MEAETKMIDISCTRTRSKCHQFAYFSDSEAQKSVGK